MVRSSSPELACREGCGACCIAPSISSRVPSLDGAQGVPKPAGMVCVQLDEQRRCRLYGQPSRPAVCRSLRPHAELCRESPEQALAWLARLERETCPS